jgi:hypothetical protein
MEDVCPHCGSRSFAWLNLPPDNPSAARCSDCSVMALFEGLRELDSRAYPPSGFRAPGDSDEKIVFDLHRLVLGATLTQWEQRFTERMQLTPTIPMSRLREAASRLADVVEDFVRGSNITTSTIRTDRLGAALRETRAAIFAIEPYWVEPQ